MMHGPAQPTAPGDPRFLDAWRAAAKAYREHIGGPQSADRSFKAATAAVLAILPELNQEQASAEAVSAVSYASQVAPEWLYALADRNS